MLLSEVRTRIRELLTENATDLPASLFFDGSGWSGLPRGLPSFLKMTLIAGPSERLSNGFIERRPLAILEIGAQNTEEGEELLSGYEDEIFDLFFPGRPLGGTSQLRVRANGLFGNERRRNGEYLTLSISVPLRMYVLPPDSP